MVFSFMAPLRGRVIQAYHDGHELVLQKSKFFGFSSVETVPFELFMRHLASMPVGNTENFPAVLRTGNNPWSHREDQLDGRQSRHSSLD